MSEIIATASTQSPIKSAFDNKKVYLRNQPLTRWTEEEHERFVMFIKTHGKEWKKIEEWMGGSKSEQ
jgi:hypothetical protein